MNSGAPERANQVFDSYIPTGVRITFRAFVHVVVLYSVNSIKGSRDLKDHELEEDRAEIQSAF